MEAALPKEGWKQHKNPDGSVGGKVFHGAVVDSTAVIERTAVIMPGAHIGPNEVVRSGTIVNKQGQQFRFG